ncbi:hypothetical protein D3C81_1868550 [compost metagenome]
MDLDRTIAPIIAPPIHGNMILSWNHFVPATPPAYQKARSCPMLKYNAIPSLSADSSALKAAPASTSLAGVRPPRDIEPIP